MEKQAEQHGEDVRKREKKVSHELKTKGNKVSALRTLGEGHGQKQKDEKKAESGEKKERVRKEECVEKMGKHLKFFFLMKKEDICRLKKVFKGFQDLRSPVLVS